MTNTRAREMLDGGYRMPSPDGAPEEMYQLMLRCWQYEPEDRPHFNEIHSSIDLLYSRYVEHFLIIESHILFNICLHEFCVLLPVLFQYISINNHVMLS